MNPEISAFGGILLYLIGGILFFMLAMAVSWLLRPKRPNAEKNRIYESGEEAGGSARAQFNIRFYVVALIFVLFDIELVFLFPWAVVFANQELMTQTQGAWGWLVLAEAFVFISLLAVGLLYAWKKGFLNWVKPTQSAPKVSSPVPPALYERFNEQYPSTHAGQPPV